MKALAINTYAGSLLLGLQAAGAEVTGSYEDAGFGVPIQRANFPDITVRDTHHSWPDKGPRGLRGTVVLAHPPCSAFSVQNTSARTRGVDSDAFACTKKVMVYAMGQGCDALAVESVTGAMAGAWKVHQRTAARYGYEVHRVLQNSILFGVPQWRERFWAVFVRKGLLPKRGFTWRLTPHAVTLGAVLDKKSAVADDPFDYLVHELEELKTRFREKAKLTPSEMGRLFGKVATAAYDGGIEHYLKDVKFPRTEVGVVCKRYVTSYSSSQMTYLSPEGYAPVLMGTSWWWYRGRLLPKYAHNRIMGFPDDYVFPGKYDEQRRTYLSKGVVPTVARWVFDNVTYNIDPTEHPMRPDSPMYATEDVATRTTRDGQVAYFRGRRKDWDAFLESGTPPLREERESVDD